jgi:D-alanine-D-alanine ligase
MRRKLKVLVLFNSEGPPPQNQDFSKWLEDEDNEDWDAERDVIRSLQYLGHQVKLLGIYDDISLLINTIKMDRPDVVFNLTENFGGKAFYDKNVASVLEILGVPFTGCGSTGLWICRNKGLTKKILTFHRIKVPRFAIFYRGRRVWHRKNLKFPLVVKPLREDASIGISQDSFAENEKELCGRVNYIHQSLKMDAIVEEYIEGRELYVSILGNQRLTVLPIREMKFGQIPEEGPRVATYKAKWDYQYRERWGISNVFAGRLPEGVSERIEEICKKAYRVLMLQGYARFDLRLTENKEVFIIEANPNPWLASYDEVAQSASKVGISYHQLIQKILNLACLRAKKGV